MMRVSFKIAAAAALVLSLCAASPHLHREKWYQEKWCSSNGGQMETVMPDKARCDCETETGAYEFDFSKKWAEAIGQALYYGAVTGKAPGIVLIVGSAKDAVYVERIRKVIEAYNLKINLIVVDRNGDETEM